jgi:hypothetical protein
MTNESNIEKLARLYTEEGFTKEQMAEEMFGNGCSFSLVVKVSLQMDYLK